MRSIGIDNDVMRTPTRCNISKEVDMVKINGEFVDYSGHTVQEALDHEGYSEKRVAVELNGAIVPKAAYESTILNDGDVMEVVSFVGGG